MKIITITQHKNRFFCSLSEEFLKEIKRTVAVNHCNVPVAEVFREFFPKDPDLHKVMTEAITQHIKRCEGCSCWFWPKAREIFCYTCSQSLNLSDEQNERCVVRR